MKTNEQLQRDVQNAIKWQPSLKAAEIGVTAKDGVITLSGTVDSYFKKKEAEDATKDVAGVKAVALDIEIKYNSSFDKNDTEIANAILNSWRWNVNVPRDEIKIKVEDGWVTLEGKVRWNYQRDAAKKSIEHLAGIKGISDNMIIELSEEESLEKESIEQGLKRNWLLKDEDVHVSITGHHVRLTGKVSSLYNKDKAANVAWNTPGVWSVRNDLVVN